MRNPLFSIAIAVAAAAAAAAADPVGAGRTPPVPPARVSPDPLSSNQIPREPGPTAEAVGGLADDPSYEGHRRIYDGAGLAVGNSAFTLKNPIGPKLGAGQPSSLPRVPDVPQKTVAAKKEDPKGPFFDDATVGFAALGILAGGTIGIGLGMLLGIGAMGPLLGAVLGAALLVGLFKWKGYKKPGEK